MPARNYIQDPDDIILNDYNDVDEILGHPPGWLLQWGLSLILVVVGIFGSISWLIKYPDIIPAQISILTEFPAIRVVAKVNGKIETLHVENNQLIEKDAIIAVIDNPAHLADVQKLEQTLSQIDQIQYASEFVNLDLAENLSLGLLQKFYANLSQKINHFKYFLRQQGHTQKASALDTQIKHFQALNENIQIQKEKLHQEVAIAQKDYERNIGLNQEGITSDADLEKLEAAYLQYDRQLDNIEQQIINNNITIEQLKTQLIEIRQNRSDQHYEQETDIQNEVQQLISEVEAWKESFLLKAPIAGRVSFSKIWSAQQFVRANEEILTIVPEQGIGQIVGKATLPIENSGKVKIGQVSNIKLDGFPFQEYGIIKGEVTSISLVPSEENYLLEISLPNELVTSYDKTIPFRQEMRGSIDIVTENRRVLERIFDRVRSILKNT